VDKGNMAPNMPKVGYMILTGALEAYH